MAKNVLPLDALTVRILEILDTPGNKPPFWDKNGWCSQWGVWQRLGQGKPYRVSYGTVRSQLRMMGAARLVDFRNDKKEVGYGGRPIVWWRITGRGALRLEECHKRMAEAGK